MCFSNFILNPVKLLSSKSNLNKLNDSFKIYSKEDG